VDQSWISRLANADALFAQKFSELKDLYHGKGMHAKALELLRE
jgi:hypothetical protein